MRRATRSARPGDVLGVVGSSPPLPDRPGGPVGEVRYGFAGKAFVAASPEEELPRKPSGAMAANAIFEALGPKCLVLRAILPIPAGGEIVSYRSANQPPRTVPDPPSHAPQTDVRLVTRDGDYAPVSLGSLREYVARNPTQRLRVAREDLVLCTDRDLAELGFVPEGTTATHLVRLPVPSKAWYRAQLGMHGASFVLHLINGILGLVALDAAGSRPPKILSTRFVYRNASAVPLNETGCGESCSPAYGDLVATRRARCLFAYDGLLVLALSELATALWQLFYIVEIMATALTFQRDECHGLRWCEYALTATAISLGQLVGTGEREVSTVLIASAALVSLQMLGWLGEAVRGRAGRWASLAPFAIGCVLQGSIFLSLFARLVYGAQEGGEGSDFDWAPVAAVYTGTYLLFPVIAFLQLTGKARYEAVELCYSASSVLTKTTVFWMIFATVIGAQEEAGAAARAGVSWPAVRMSATALAGAGGLGVLGLTAAAAARGI